MKTFPPRRPLLPRMMKHRHPAPVAARSQPPPPTRAAAQQCSGIADPIIMNQQRKKRSLLCGARDVVRLSRGGVTSSPLENIKDKLPAKLLTLPDETCRGYGGAGARGGGGARSGRGGTCGF